MFKGLRRQDTRSATDGQWDGGTDGANGGSPAWKVVAPGRINVIGEHVDYHGGVVLPMAIDRSVTFEAVPNGVGEIRVTSDLEEAENARLILGSDRAREATGAWHDYLTGCVLEFQTLTGSLPVGMDVRVSSTLDPGAGLSSSAALVTGFATLLCVANAIGVAPAELAQMCQRAEREYVGVPCGIMDHLACLCGQRGQVLFIDCEVLDYSPVPFTLEGVEIWVTNSGVRHALVDGGYADRQGESQRALEVLGKESFRQVCNDGSDLAALAADPLLERRGRHVTGEIARVFAARAALGKGDVQMLGRLLFESHWSLARDYEVSCPEVDWIVTYAAGHPHLGFLGSRMTGGGFGGSVIHLVARETAREAMDRLRAGYLAETGIDLQPFPVRPTDGVSVLDAAVTTT